MRTLKLLGALFILLLFLVQCGEESIEADKTNTDTLQLSWEDEGSIFPAHAATGVSTSFTLRWKKATGLDNITYDIFYDTIQDLSKASKTGLTGNSYDISNLFNDKTYYWKVVATAPQGNKDTSNTWNFTTISNNANATFSYNNGVEIQQGAIVRTGNNIYDVTFTIAQDDLSSIEITPTKEDAQATIDAPSNKDYSGGSSKAFKVTAEDGTTINTYNVKIEKQKWYGTFTSEVKLSGTRFFVTTLELTVSKNRENGSYLIDSGTKPTSAEVNVLLTEKGFTPDGSKMRNKDLKATQKRTLKDGSPMYYYHSLAAESNAKDTNFLNVERDYELYMNTPTSDPVRIESLRTIPMVIGPIEQDSYNFFSEIITEQINADTSLQSLNRISINNPLPIGENEYFAAYALFSSSTFRQVFIHKSNTDKQPITLSFDTQIVNPNFSSFTMHQFSDNSLGVRCNSKTIKDYSENVETINQYFHITYTNSEDNTRTYVFMRQIDVP